MAELRIWSKWLDDTRLVIRPRAPSDRAVSTQSTYYCRFPRRRAIRPHLSSLHEYVIPELDTMPVPNASLNGSTRNPVSVMRTPFLVSPTASTITRPASSNKHRYRASHSADHVKPWRRPFGSAFIMMSELDWVGALGRSGQTNKARRAHPENGRICVSNYTYA